MCMRLPGVFRSSAAFLSEPGKTQTPCSGGSADLLVPKKRFSSTFEYEAEPLEAPMERKFSLFFFHLFFWRIEKKNPFSSENSKWASLCLSHATWALLYARDQLRACHTWIWAHSRLPSGSMKPRGHTNPYLVLTQQLVSAIMSESNLLPAGLKDQAGS